MTDSDAGVAIYWDFENVHACVLDGLRGEGAYRAVRFQPQEPLVDIDPVAEYAATFGRIVVHRAYGNWQYFSRYRDELQGHAVDLVQLFPLAGSKNGADIRLVLDVAEDLQQHAHLTHVMVIASDSDYTSLAQRCRKHGRFFVGVGTARTASSYKSACDEFRIYRDLAADGAPSAAQEPAVGGRDLAPLEDAAELVVKAVRRLAAGSGESWALKAGVRPMVKRLDPAFDERNFGFSTFAELLRALDATIAERPGEHDHELAVRADADGQALAPGAPAMASLAPAVLAERQLRRQGVRLPAERPVMWAVPELIVDAFGACDTSIQPGFESLRLKIGPGAAALGFALSEVDFNKLKGVLWRARAFGLHGPGKGISLRIPDVHQLRFQMVTVLLEHLADPAAEDPAVLAETFFGPGPTSEQEQLVRDALQALMDARIRDATASP